jgi:hypothetical protein
VKRYLAAVIRLLLARNPVTLEEVKGEIFGPGTSDVSRARARAGAVSGSMSSDTQMWFDVAMEIAQFGAVDVDIAGRREPEADLVTANRNDGQADVVADDDFLANLAAEH